MVDGSYFGTTFPHLFLMSYPLLQPTRPTEAYVPKVFGFRIHASAKARQQQLAAAAAAGGMGATTANQALTTNPGGQQPSVATTTAGKPDSDQVQSQQPCGGDRNGRCLGPTADGTTKRRDGDSNENTNGEQQGKSQPMQG